MSTRKEIWNLSSLCRCCHNDGKHKSLDSSYIHGSETEVYSLMIRETFGIEITRPILDGSYTICEDCIIRLRDASQFKKKVAMCEEKFEAWCKDEIVLHNSFTVKIEIDEVENDCTNDAEYDVDIVENKVKPEDCSNDAEYEVDIVENKVKPEAVEITIDEGTKIEEVDLKPVKEEKPQTQKQISNRKHTTPRDIKPKYDFSQEVFVKTDSGIIYSCKTCGGSYNDRKLIKDHIRTNHLLGDPYTCDICHKTFKNKPAVSRHRLTHDKNLQCKQCTETFTTTYSLRKHLNSHTKKTAYKCDFCSKQFFQKINLKRHIEMHIDNKKKCICDVCGHGFNDRTNLTIHIKTVHEKLRPFICDICQKTFSAKKNLLLHIHKHMGYKSYRCDLCQKCFYTYSERKSHKCLGSQNPKYTCVVCSKTYEDKKLFLRHVKRTHSGERPYKCMYCPKDFTCKYSKNRHEFSHSGLKPFSCEQCGKSFSQKPILERHMRKVHRKEENKEIKCPICKNFFANLSKHISTCVKPDRVKCDICYRSYSHKNALNRHKKIVHTGLKYKCLYCEAMYGKRSTLVKHQKKAHNIDENDIDLAALTPIVIKNKDNNDL